MKFKIYSKNKHIKVGSFHWLLDNMQTSNTYVILSLKLITNTLTTRNEKQIHSNELLLDGLPDS